MNRENSNSRAVSAKAKILTSAHTLFYLHGIRATGIDKIIEHACVTKVTFYRHFPSKNLLILAYLDYRHTLWMDWFSRTLKQHDVSTSDPVEALLSTMRLWWAAPDFRGCAFLNATAEMSEALPEVDQLTCDHKAAVAAELATRWSLDDSGLAAIVMALDGAIMHVQMGYPIEQVAGQLRQMLTALLAATNKSA